MKGGPFGIYQHPFCRKTPKIEGGSLWGKNFRKKVSQCRKKTEMGDSFVSYGIVCYAGTLFGSFSWANRDSLKFCRIFGRTVLVTSGASKIKNQNKTLTKKHDYSRLFSRKEPTKKEVESSTKLSKFMYHFSEI